MEKTYIVEGMSCVICKNTVEKGLKQIKGVNDCKVNLLENEATINYDETVVSEDILAITVKNLGYKLVINKVNTINYTKVKIFISTLFTLTIMYCAMAPMFNIKVNDNSKYIQAILALLVIIININIYSSGFKALFKLKPNMYSLVCVSSFVSYLYSLYVLFLNKMEYHLYFETAAMILLIVSIGKYIEGTNKKKVTKTIRGLQTLIPMQCTLIKENNELTTIPIDELKVNDLVLIRPGESIPQDGIVLNGESNVDESMVTGESIPQIKKIDDKVIGGTININGELRIKITTNANQQTVSKIIILTKQAYMSKIPIERVADRIASYFVYGVLLIALITFVLWYLTSNNIEQALNYSLSVLVISCPCALGLATPAAIAVSVNCAAKNGILIKNPAILEVAHKVKYILLDKTGTLTKNKLQIIDVKQYDDSFIDVLVSLEKLSNHPISKTILAKYKKGNIVFDKFEQLSSRGLIAYKDNDIYYAGNLKLANKYTSINEINNEYSTIYVGKNNQLLGIVYLGDVLKDTSIKAIEEFKKRNLISIMCTGDNKIIANDIAETLKIDDYYAEITPEDKNKLIKEKQKTGTVLMAGDGINDAIALSSADVSVSVSNGTDIANATSDVILLSNSILDIAFLIDLSKKTIHIIKQNLLWALCYNAILIPVAAGLLNNSLGISLNPILSSISMSISSIFVLTNALRINTIKKEDLKTMNKTVMIEGMMCMHCVEHVKQALEKIGAEATISLDENKAYIKNTTLSDEQITEAITNAGYTVTGITND